MADDSVDALMGAVLLQKERGVTRALSKELHTFFRASGCDPHCHFCLEPLNVGDEFGFKRLRASSGLTVGIKGTACLRCIREDRPAPQVAVTEAEERAKAESMKSLDDPPMRRGFLLFD